MSDRVSITVRVKAKLGMSAWSGARVQLGAIRNPDLNTYPDPDLDTLMLALDFLLVRIFLLDSGLMGGVGLAVLSCGVLWRDTHSRQGSLLYNNIELGLVRAS